ncbi:MAG: hypothetical protein U1E73_08880 [Planctomycetota bacterium]
MALLPCPCWHCLRARVRSRTSRRAGSRTAGARVAAARGQTTGGGKPLRVGFLLGLCVLTRYDMVWITGSLAVGILWRQRLGMWMQTVVVAMATVVPWLVFATIYYGSPLPTTAHAKLLSVGLGAGELFAQGARYGLDTVVHDPVTALGIGLGLAIGFVWRREGTGFAAAGVLLHLAYVARVGGDFMSGRFLTPAFVLAVWIVTVFLRAAPRPRVAGWAALAVLALAFIRGVPVQFVPWKPPPPRVESGIADERAGYHAMLGLWAHRRPPLVARQLEPLLPQAAGPVVAFTYAAGWLGLLGGPRLRIVDPYLCDALLVRLPVCRELGLRPGHYGRRLPEGYLESLVHEDNRIEHPGLHRYYDLLLQVLHSPAFGAERWRAVLALESTEARGWLADYVATDYATPPLRAVAADALPEDCDLHVPWFQTDARIVYDGGLRIDRGERLRGATVELAVRSDAEVLVEFWRDGAMLAQSTSPPPPDIGALTLQFLGGFRWVALVPPPAQWDHLVVRNRNLIDGILAVAAVRSRD